MEWFDQHIDRRNSQFIWSERRSLHSYMESPAPRCEAADAKGLLRKPTSTLLTHQVDGSPVHWQASHIPWRRGLPTRRLLRLWHMCQGIYTASTEKTRLSYERMLTKTVHKSDTKTPLHLFRAIKDRRKIKDSCIMVLGSTCRAQCFCQRRYRKHLEPVSNISVRTRAFTALPFSLEYQEISMPTQDDSFAPGIPNARPAGPNSGIRDLR